MKTCKISFVLPVLVAGLGFVLAVRAGAQTPTVLHIFQETGIVSTNSGGASPNSLIVSNNTLYGTAGDGYSSGNGGLFKLNPDGTGFTNLHIFSAGCTNDDGAIPNGLIISGNTLYGTAGGGGASGNGTVFAINTDGTGFRTLYNFTALAAPGAPTGTNSDGAGPQTLILSGNTLFGIARFGGSLGNGAVFAINTDGTDFRTLYSFTAPSGPAGTNSDGSAPNQLFLSGNTLYGAASEGGTSGNGTVFAINTDGTGFRIVHSFSGTSVLLGNLALSGKTLYWMEDQISYFPDHNEEDWGLVAINTDGTGFTNNLPSGSWSDYYVPGFTANFDISGLFLSGDTLYWTSGEGYWYYAGPIDYFHSVSDLYAVNTDGTGYRSLHQTNSSFGGGGFVALSGNTLYRITQGPQGSGSLFSLSFPPHLTISPSRSNIILTWPTNYFGFDYTGYTVQSTTNLGFPAAWVANSPAPFVIGGQNVVINPASGPQQFYRLIH